ncbi:hypothetical protein APED_25015 [Acanthopleuribacter pedis]
MSWDKMVFFLYTPQSCNMTEKNRRAVLCHLFVQGARPFPDNAQKRGITRLNIGRHAPPPREGNENIGPNHPNRNAS